MKKYWFKPKRYGYGAYPVTWQGYLFLFVMIGLVLVSAYINGFFNLSQPTIPVESILRFLLDLVILIGLFTALAHDKVDGELAWRWGEKK